MPSTDSFQFQAQIPAEESDQPTLERFQQIIDERTGRSDIRLYDATWLSLYRVNVRMVDRYRVVVFPVITGNSGRERIYDGYPDVALEMISSRTFDGRIQLLEYVPTILAGPPGTNAVNA